VALAARGVLKPFLGAATGASALALTKTDLTSATSSLRTLAALAALPTLPESSGADWSLSREFPNKSITLPIFLLWPATTERPLTN
jgi:hypothetical protein